MDLINIHFKVVMKDEIVMKYIVCFVLTILMACCGSGTNQADVKYQATNSITIPREHIPACETMIDINEFNTSELKLTDDELRYLVGSIWSEYSSELIGRIKKACGAGKKCSENKFNLLLQLNSFDKVLELTKPQLLHLNDGEQIYEVAVGNNTIDLLVGTDSLEINFVVFEFAILDFRRSGDNISLVVFFRKNISAQIGLDTVPGKNPEWNGIRGAGTLEAESAYECIKIITENSNNAKWNSSKVSCCLDKK